MIVPARNEEDCLGACLESLVSQSEEIFELGRDWELIVVDDHSSDRTAEIARGFAGVTVWRRANWSRAGPGKRNAIWTAARHARGRWLLFTDADTVHEPGDLRRAMHEAERHKAGMLSYSPRQIVRGLAQRSLMPLVFCELALAYPPAKVSDPDGAHRRGKRAVSAGGARGLPQAGRPCQRCRQGAGRRGTGVSGQAAQGRAAVPLCRTMQWPRACTGRRRDDRGLDEEPGAAV